MSGSVGQCEPQGTIQTLSFSSRSPQEEAGSAPNCCRFSPRFSRPPCSGLRGAGKVVPISFPLCCKGCTTWLSLPAPCLTPCTPLRFPLRFWSCQESSQRFAWPHCSYTLFPAPSSLTSTSPAAAACSPCHPLCRACSVGSGGSVLCSLAGMDAGSRMALACLGWAGKRSWWGTLGGEAREEWPWGGGRGNCLSGGWQDGCRN